MNEVALKSKLKQSLCLRHTKTVSVCVFPLDLLHASTHQTGEDGHHHFGVDLHQVLRQGVDLCSNLPRHGNGIPDAGKGHS